MTASALRPARPGNTTTRTDAHQHTVSYHDVSRRSAGRARMAAVGVLAIALLSTAACGKKGADDPQADPTFGTIITESPGATADASGATGPSGTPQASSTGGGQQPPTYPSSAKDYGAVTLSAWTSNNKSRLDQLATQPAVMQLTGHQVSNGQWTNLSCSTPSSGYTQCKYRNAHGDEAQVTMQNSQLGHPTATTEALISKTYFPTNAGDYVGAFMNAWSEGNTQRMSRLSSSSIAGSFNGKTPPTGSQSNPTQNGSTWTVEVTGLPLGSGNYKFTLNGSKLGTANAITAASIS